MRFFVLLTVIGASMAATASLDKDAPILKQVVDIAPDGSWHYRVETGNGINIERRGQIKTVDQKPVAEESGSVSYTAPDGQPIQLTWVADEHGYQPQGSHLPVAPPVPQAIQRALEYAAAHPPTEASVTRKPSVHV